MCVCVFLSVAGLPVSRSTYLAMLVRVESYTTSALFTRAFCVCRLRDWEKGSDWE